MISIVKNNIISYKIYFINIFTCRLCCLRIKNQIIIKATKNKVEKSKLKYWCIYIKKISKVYTIKEYLFFSKNGNI